MILALQHMLVEPDEMLCPRDPVPIETIESFAKPLKFSNSASSLINHFGFTGYSGDPEREKNTFCTGDEEFRKGFLDQFPVAVKHLENESFIVSAGRILSNISLSGSTGSGKFYMGPRTFVNGYLWDPMSDDQVSLFFNKAHDQSMPFLDEITREVKAQRSPVYRHYDGPPVARWVVKGTCLRRARPAPTRGQSARESSTRTQSTSSRRA